MWCHVSSCWEEFWVFTVRAYGYRVALFRKSKAPAPVLCTVLSMKLGTKGRRQLQVECALTQVRDSTRRNAEMGGYPPPHLKGSS